MKKFLLLIWELLVPKLTYLLMFFLGAVAFGWAISLFGLFVFFGDGPLWLKWAIGIFDMFCLIMLIYSWVYGTWLKVCKKNI